ncbi:ThuA domain-containing protein [Nocardioides lijunqiniae]|uniref:ThuA domain-containing protein n=1 Tax=Nocardioides lijunqiniae TaxID=2760832 RepID=UPI001878120F|nr:ThuA domain-containing protein [Nocardioides lijunqiniae]
MSPARASLARSASRFTSRFASILLAFVVGVGVMALTAPPVQAHPGHGHVLIFSKTTQFRHTEAIAQGTPVLKAALEAEGMQVTVSEDSALFTDANLAQYDAIMMFQASGDPWDADQKAALQRYVQAGGGIVGVHNATDMRGDWAWWDAMVGTVMPGHAATGTTPGLPGTVRVEDHDHPSTEHLEQRWSRADEWYNYSTNVRGDAHVLATMDESTYDAGGNKMGYDHPISWCKPYDGGRTWMTGMGHFGSHYTAEPAFVQHIVGGTKYAAGLEPGDCGGTVWDNYEKVALDENTSAPFAMDVAPDGKVFYTELVRGEIRVYDPTTQVTSTAVSIPVYSGGEDGLLGITLANDFAESGHLYVYYAPAATNGNESDPVNFFSNLSRLTYDHTTGTIDRATEKILLKVPARRLPDEPGHTGGGLDMDAQGNLYLGVGDDVNPHSEPSGGYAPLSTRNGTFHDARETSANTNDLRGKLLRITPKADGTYAIPEGNLFAEADDATGKTRPEIYAMGFRNPFRFSVDQRTGWVGLADYSPDNNTDAPATRGPAGIAEYNVIKSPGNYGWPLCMGANEPFRKVDYGTTSAGPVVVGAYFDCAAPVNDSPRNTGLTQLPPARAADMFYGYNRTSAPGVINAGGGLAPMGGPFYEYDADLDSDTKFPAYYDGKPFFFEWARNKMYSVDLSQTTTDPGKAVEKVNTFLPQEQFLAPIDSRFGPDGSLYVLDWGGGYGRDNPSSGLHRIDYISGSRSPVAVIETSVTSGPAPLTVEFDGASSSDPEGEDLTYAWDFDGDGATDATGATASHTYGAVGVFSARLTVTDPAGKDGTTTVPITVGNTEPTVAFDLPPDGSFFDFGDDLSWDVTVTDPEDGTIEEDEVVIQPALGHDYHAHPTQPFSGLTGTTPTSLGGHAPDENIFFAIDARYTDHGGEGGANPLTGSATTLVLPKTKQAEFFTAKSPSMTVGVGRDIAGGDRVLSGQDGAWASYSPVNLYRIDQLALRVSAARAGTIELRRDTADGELLSTVEVPATGPRYVDVLVDAPEVEETFDLVVVMPGAGERRLNFIEAVGQGSSPDTRPVVRITAPAEGTALPPGTDVEVAASATDSAHDITQVEFFAGDQSLGTDTQAPYTATWLTPTEEGVHELTAVATSSSGATTTSRVVGAQVGELFGALVPFSNAGGEFEKTGPGAFRITGAGANAWQAVDQYSSLYLPGGVDDDTWEAVVRVDGQSHANGGAKSGLIVRNDIAAPGSSAGYAYLGIRPTGGVEWLRDPDGNGQLNASDAGGSTAYPTWLMIKRNGTSYTAHYSRNGTTWTQVGPAATLTGAATPQDIGMTTTAHSGTPGTADFSQFSVDTDPVQESPEQTYEPLTCLSPLSDEFGTGLNGKWSVRQQTGKAVRTAAGALLMPVTTSDINEATPGPVSFVGQPAPSGSWEASTKLTLAHATHWQYAGLMLHRSDDEYTKLAFVKNQNGNRFLEFQTETAGARTTHASFTVPAGFPTTAYLKLVSDGTGLRAHYSTDGVAWTQLTGSAAPIKADAELGLVAAGDTGVGDTVASVDWFRVTPDRTAPAFTPDDEFEGDALDGCRWAQTVRYDADHVSVGDGHLDVETQVGDINGANPLNPRNFVLQDAPEGDWVATTRFKAPLKVRYQLAGLLMYTDDDNYVKADVVAYNAPGTAVDLRAEMAGESNGTGFGGRNVNIADTSESGYWYVRVTKTGSSYTSEVSDGGVTWTPIGAALTYDKPLTGLGLMAIGPEQDEPVTVSFDYVRLGGEEEPVEDTTAPTTTATLDPAQADGANGWFVTEPELTLSADDGEGSGVESTEYRIDEGGWTAYDGPVTVTGDGEHTVEYRSTDVEGNVEEVGSTEVRVDRVAPVTTAAQAVAGDGVRVTLTAVDATSGVASTQYALDGGDWTDYSAPVLVEGEGDHTMLVRSTDAAGLVEATRTVTVTVAGGPADTTGPTVQVTGLRPGFVYGHAQQPVLRWTTRPTGDAVRSVTATLDGKAVRAGRVDLSRLRLGSHTLVVRAVDVRGNTTTVRVAFRVRTSIADVKGLVNRAAKAGAMGKALRNELVAGLNRARQLERRRPALAAAQLREVRRDAGRIRSASVRALVRQDLAVLIRGLR